MKYVWYDYVMVFMVRYENFRISFFTSLISKAKCYVKKPRIKSIFVRKIGEKHPSTFYNTQLSITQYPSYFNIRFSFSYTQLLYIHGYVVTKISLNWIGYCISARKYNISLVYKYFEPYDCYMYRYIFLYLHYYAIPLSTINLFSGNLKETDEHSCLDFPFSNTSTKVQAA